MKRRCTLSYCSHVPYEISFTKPVAVSDSNIYINDCCWGGDVVRDELLPLISGNFEDVVTEQEDWGWFIWFRRGPIRLAVDIFCDDPRHGSFRLRLTSRRKRLLIGDSVVDTPELEEVRKLVSSHLASWAGTLGVERVD